MFAGFSYIRTVAQSIPNGAATLVQFDKVVEDAGGFKQSAYPVDTFVVPDAGAGVYLIGASVQWDVSATGERSATVQAGPDGNTDAILQIDGEVVPTGTGFFTHAGSVVRRLAAGEVVRLSVFQSSGGALDLVGDSVAFPCLWACYIGP